MIGETSADSFRIRSARGDEVEAMQMIDIASSSMFRGLGLIDFGPDDRQITPIPENIIRQAFADQLVWVASDERDRAIGFALCTARDTELYLDQVSVLPEHGQQGLGGRLLDRVFDAAYEGGYKSISLSTFRDVPWNGPFYKKKGFREVPHGKLKPWQLQLHESQKLTMDVTKRCFMQRAVRRGWWTTKTRLKG